MNRLEAVEVCLKPSKLKAEIVSFHNFNRLNKKYDEKLLRN